MFYLLSASLIWAFSYGLIKSELSSLDPNFVTVCRMLAAFIVFLPFLNVKKNKKLMSHLMFIGAIQYGLMYLFVLRSYHYLDAYQVVLFSAMTPFYVILINSLAEQRFKLNHFIVAGLAILGAAIIYNLQAMSADTLWGFSLVQCSDMCFAFGQMAYRKVKQNNRDIQDKELYAFLFLGALVTAVLFTTVFDGWHSLYDVTLKQSVILIYLGAIASGVCFFWWNKGIVQLHPVMISVFNNLKLPLATIVSIICFHEQVSPQMHLAYGLLVLVFALALAQRYQHQYNTAITVQYNVCK